jgi:DNA-binding CsgD family transcriptional regulator
MFDDSKIPFGKSNLSETMNNKDVPGAKLTKREEEVLRLLATAMNRDEIADKLFISEETVKMHIKNSYRKLKAKNKIDALIKMRMI